MLRQVWALTRKEIRIFLQRPARLATLVLTPLVFIAVFGAVFGGSDTPTVAVFLVDADGSRPAKQAVDLLDDVKTLEITVLDDRAEAERRVADGERMAAIVVPAGFAAALTTDQGAEVQIVVDPARRQQAGMVAGQVTAALAPLLVDAEVTRGVTAALEDAGDSFGLDEEALLAENITLEDVEKFLVAALRGVVSSQVQDAFDAPLVRVELAPQGSPAARQPGLMDYLVPGYTLFFAFFIMGMMAPTVLFERRTGAYRRLLTTPATRAAILLGKALPYFLIAFLQVLAVGAISSLFFSVSLGESTAAYLLMAAATAAVVAGLGMLIAAVARTEGQAGALPDLITIGMAVASGALFPAIVLPGVAQFTPHYWAIRGFQDVMARGGDVAAILPEVGVLLAMAAAFFAVAVWRFKFD